MSGPPVGNKPPVPPPPTPAESKALSDFSDIIVNDLTHLLTTNPLYAKLKAILDDLGALQSKYKELVARDPSTLTEEEKAWMKKVEDLVDRMNNADPSSRTFTDDLGGELKTLLANKPTSGPLYTSKEQNPYFERYNSTLNDYIAAGNELKTMEARIKALQERNARGELSAAELQELNDLLGQYKTKLDEYTTYGNQLDTLKTDIENSLTPAAKQAFDSWVAGKTNGLSDPAAAATFLEVQKYNTYLTQLSNDLKALEEVNAKIAALLEKKAGAGLTAAEEEALKTLQGTQATLEGKVKTDLAYFTTCPPLSDAAKGQVLPGLDDLKTRATAAVAKSDAETYEAAYAKYAKDVADYIALSSQISALLQLYRTVGLTPEQAATLKGLLATRDTLEKTLETDRAYFTQHPLSGLSPDAQALINGYLAGKTPLDQLNTTVDNQGKFNLSLNPSVDAFNRSAGLTSYSQYTSQDYAQWITWSKNIGEQLQEFYKIMATRPLTADEQAKFNDLISRAKDVGIKLSIGLSHVVPETSPSYDDIIAALNDLNAIVLLKNSGYLDLLATYNAKVKEYNSLMDQIKALMDKANNGTITEEEKATLTGLVAKAGTLLNDINTTKGSMDKLVTDNPKIAPYVQKLQDAGVITPFDAVAAAYNLNAVKYILEIYAKADELKTQQDLIIALMDKVNAGGTLTAEEKEQLKTAIEAYNRLSSELKVLNDNLLATLQSLMPKAAADGTYTAEQKAEMLRLLAMAGAYQAHMGSYAAGNAAFLKAVKENYTKYFDQIAAGGLSSERSGELSALMLSLDGIAKYEPLDLTPINALIAMIQKVSGLYYKEVPMFQKLWDTFMGNYQRASDQVDALLALMKTQQDQLAKITLLLNNLNSALAGTLPLSAAALAALGLDKASLAKLAEPPLSLKLDLSTLTAPEGSKEYLTQLQGLLQAQQDILKNSSASNQLLLENALNLQKQALTALTNFLEQQTTLMQSIAKNI